MGKIKSRCFVLGLALASALPAWTDDLAAIKQALTAKYALTTATADKTDIVTAGSVLVLKKTGLITVDVKSKNLYGNSYKNGRITQNAMGKTSKWLKKLPGASDVPGAGGAERTFVSGEKVWVTGIDIRENGIVFTLYTDAYSDTRYEANLTFPFEKGSTPTVTGTEAQVAEVFEIQAADDAKTQQPAAQQGSSGGPGPQAPAPVAPKQVEAPPPPIAPPPPPPADPKSIAVGQTIDQVVANFGQPTKILKPAGKQIYVYPDMKVIFVNSKVADIQ